MLIKEYRVILPITVEEYQIAQLWSTAQVSKENTGGGEGIEILHNKPFDNKSDLLEGFTAGQYTHKLYKLQSKVPWWIRKLAPKGSMELHEEAWNAYPYCRTVITNPDYMKENFIVKIETLHLQDKGNTENAHRLTKEQLNKREVVVIDIANDSIQSSDYKESEDPTKFKSQKTGRGPLVGKDWKNECTPVMCCYKLVTVEFKWFGLQSKIESFIHKSERRLFTKFHRQVFCWMDNWHGLTLEDIRRIEDETQKELNNAITQGTVKGMTTADE